MSSTTLRGLTIPTTSDDLLAAWQKLSDTAGVITVADSVAAARATLDQMSAANAAPSSRNPAYFDIGGVVYRADGRKSGRVWTLAPLNEVEFDDVTYSGSWRNSLNAGQSSTMMTSRLPARPYARRVAIDANIWAYALRGNMDMALSAHGKMKLARIASGEAHSVSATLQVVIPAGVQPDITVSIRGASGGGEASLAQDSRFNTLSVTAYPITMS